MAHDEKLTTKDDGGAGWPFRRSSFVFRRVVIVLLAGASLGLFLARFWYELDPVRFAAFGDWPATLLLAVFGAIFLATQWQLALRSLIPTGAILSVHSPFALLLVYSLWPEVDLRLAAIVLLTSVGLAAALGLRAIGAQPISSVPAWLSRRAQRRFAPIALAAIVFAIYLRTLGTHVGRADTFEFQVVAPALGIAHPTGYPLLVMIGKLFSLLPIGSMAFRVNLSSAVLATAATVVVYSLIVWLSGRRLAAFLAALAFAVSGVMWSQAVEVEVYALNALIVGAVLALLIDLAQSLDPAGSQARPTSTRGQRLPVNRSVPLVFLLLGLGLSHHLTTVLLMPATVLTILIVRPRLPIRTTLAALGFFLLGLSMWLYIPLRWPALNGGTPMTLSGFVDWITGARYGGALALGAWSDPVRWQIVTRLLLEAFGPAGAALSAVGVVGLALKQWRAALITFVTFAAYVFFGLVYFVPDLSVFMIPAHLIMAIWMGAGVASVANLLTARTLLLQPDDPSGNGGSFIWTGRRQSIYSLSLIVFLLIPISLMWHNYPLVDRRGVGAKAEAWGRYILGLPIPAGAATLVDSEKIAPLYYLQVTDRLRPDLDILVLGTEDEYRHELDMRLAKGQPVYLARFLPNIPYRMRSLGPLVEVSNEIKTVTPPGFNPVKFGDVIELVSLSREEGDPARVTFGWRAMTDRRPNYHVRLRLIDDQTRVWWQDDGTHPVGGYYPTSAWVKDEVVADYHEIEFNPAFPPGAYTLQVGLFPPFRDDGLQTGDGSLWWSVVRLIAPYRPAPSLDRALRQMFGGRIAVTGASPIGVTPQSSDGELRLNWARTGLPSSQPRVALSLVDTAGQAAWSERVDPYRGSLPVQDWPPGPLQATLGFHTPDRDGTYTLRLGFVDGEGVPLPAKCSWLAPPATDCPIGVVQVAGEAIGNAINFDNQVLLRQWTIDRTELRPGETIHVKLEWHGLQKWDADYTVFVHLVGPDGILHGQVDAWPAEGTLPTSAWPAGQTLSDPYGVTLQPGAPSGRYQIEVGWYLLATLRRLPVLDEAGRPSDDHFIAGEFSVP